MNKLPRVRGCKQQQGTGAARRLIETSHDPTTNDPAEPSTSSDKKRGSHGVGFKGSPIAEDPLPTSAPASTTLTSQRNTDAHTATTTTESAATTTTESAATTTKRPKPATRIRYSSVFDLTQQLPRWPVSVRCEEKFYPYVEEDDKHIHANTQWRAKRRPRSINYSKILGPTCDFYEFNKPHPDEAMRKSYLEKYSYARPYAPAALVKTEDDSVTINRIPHFSPQEYSHLSIGSVVLCFRNISFARMKVLESDITDIIMLFSSFVGGTVYDILFPETGRGKCGLGQVLVVMDRVGEFLECFTKRPCIVDHNGVFVLKAEHANDINYPKEKFKKQSNNGNTETYEYPVEFVSLLKLADQLSYTYRK